MSTPSEPSSTASSARSRVRRRPERAHYDADTVAAILDSALVCHIAFQWEGSVHALGTAHWREGDHLYIHGARASRMLKALAAGQACVTVTQVDGLVFGRTPLHHSMNYRSLVAYGQFEPVEDEAEKAARLQAFIERLAPGRWATLRPMNDKELAATAVLRLPLDEVSAKIRDHGVIDEASDLGWPVWAGVVPLALRRGAPVADGQSRVAEAPARLGAIVPPV
ncbi:pyridoxamine 5'-phosphate oxidase family protein [Azoarcus indigens]|uniref:Nitroimidazol reductase NimA-like FMN-containing flavoprotein (Pyridoxamine 5'-phosphate oxidase superfamily) n=1 Tax=Azoarcus indigens TaxID=29545 RepID=A0A4R6DSC9_9RHOO|nr:pyridoxamine 5'-phosphate oxidase family protein [Azoarcus indigens]NMG66969.1 pyridoxamine 5'-phosphate oxidase family protein [Azoarcus indigens]TDN47429.1 hypothetical protein C7389_12096 [Azoarcus indigens]